MRKLIGVIAVALLVVAFSAPTAQAVTPVVCSQENAFSQPTGRPAPYTRTWTGYRRTIVVKGSVAARFDGTCPGFISGKLIVTVRNPGGSVLRRTRAFENLPFRNGFEDTGRRFTFKYWLRYRQPIPAGTCVTVAIRWRPWRYNDNTLVDGNVGKLIRSRGCYRSSR